jgi:hypothetical protein
MSDRRCYECWKLYDKLDTGFIHKSNLPKLLRDLEIPISRTELCDCLRVAALPSNPDRIEFVRFRGYYRSKKMKHRAKDNRYTTASPKIGKSREPVRDLPPGEHVYGKSSDLNSGLGVGDTMCWSQEARQEKNKQNRARQKHQTHENGGPSSNNQRPNTARKQHAWLTQDKVEDLFTFAPALDGTRMCPVSKSMKRTNDKHDKDSTPAG